MSVTEEAGATDTPQESIILLELQLASRQIKKGIALLRNTDDQKQGIHFHSPFPKLLFLKHWTGVYF